MIFSSFNKKIASYITHYDLQCFTLKQNYRWLGFIKFIWNEFIESEWKRETNEKNSWNNFIPGFWIRICSRMHARRKIHPQDPWTRRSTKREGMKRVLTRDTSTIETSQTRSNGTKVAETKEKEEESWRKARGWDQWRKDKIERKINRDLEEVNLSYYRSRMMHARFLYACISIKFYKYRNGNWYQIEANYLSIICCTMKWFKRKLNDFEEYIILF